MLIGVLILVTGYYLVDTLLLNPSDGDNTTVKNTTVSAGKNGSVTPVSEIAALVPIKWNGTWKNDPFFYVPKDTAVAGGGVIDELFGRSGSLQTTKFDLTGISWLGNSGYAIINGSIVKQGETVRGFKVEQVAIDYVVLKQGTNTIRLSLNE